MIDVCASVRMIKFVDHISCIHISFVPYVHMCIRVI